MNMQADVEIPVISLTPQSTNFLENKRYFS